MARPQKNNADYFPHDANMRDDRRIKALRTRHHLTGYAVWCILLETLTDADNFTLPWDTLNQELLAGDIGIPTTQLLEIIQYMIQLQLIQHNPETQQIYTTRHQQRMQPILDERERKRQWKQQQTAKATPQTTTTGISDGENPQSKVKEIKGKESKLNPSIEGERHAPAHEDEEKSKKQPAAAEKSPLEGGKGGDNHPTPTFADQTNADTPTQLNDQLLAFYVIHPDEWHTGILEKSNGKQYNSEKLAKILTAFCDFQIKNQRGRLTYAQQNAALQHWVKDQPNHDRAPNAKTYNSHKNTDYPITDHHTIRQHIQKQHPAAAARFTDANIATLAKAPNEATFYEWAANIAKKIHNGHDQARTGETTLQNHL